MVKLMIKKSGITSNVIIAIACCSLFISFVLLNRFNERRNKQQFYSRSVSSIVIDSSLYYGRSIEYKLLEGSKVYLTKSHKCKIAIGDSIQKQKSTYMYDVYRKNSKFEYKFVGTYDFRKIN